MLVALLVVFLLGSARSQDPNFFKYTGFLTVNETVDANLFYWYLPAQNGDSYAPLILWLNGGPGCSSIGMGLFYENGPYGFNAAGTIVPNPYTWNKKYKMLYIDQPVGTGFSYVTNPDGYVRSEETLTEELYTALTLFFGKFPNLLENDFYIFGESYAGKYIPYIATYIHQQNANKSPTQINLKGIGIGDGWSDPIVQIFAYADFAYSTGLVDTSQKQLIEKLQSETAVAIHEQRWEDANNLWNNITLDIMEWAGWINPSDIRTFGEPDFGAGTRYLNSVDVQELMHIQPNVSFQMCNFDIGNDFISDQMKSVKPLFSLLLENYKVILFNGNFDFTVPPNGAQMWIDTIEWSGQQEYLAADRQIWKVNSNVAGFVKEYNNLNQVIVYNAGHMATMDQQQNVQDMVDRFITGKPWSS